MVDTKQTDLGTTGPETADAGDFVLKHRVTGAAFLLFFGALVLPWLLGPPTTASKTMATAQADTGDGQISSAEIENEMLNELENNADVEPEQVYISKITPLDAERIEEEKRRAEAEKQSKSSAAAMAMANVGDKPNGGSDKSSDKEPDSSAKSSTKDKSASKDDSEPAKDVKPTKDVEKVVKKKDAPSDKVASANKEADNTAEKTESTATSPKPDSRENALAKALAAESGVSEVDVGWVVQVGVFTDRKGADKVVKDLKVKGFKPSTSVVDTNRGKATGTRVWLGPFAQRVDAAKTKTRLTDRTGEPGFIRAYP